MRPPARCGTDGGYYRHLRTLKEPACEACKAAHAAAQAGRHPDDPRTRECRVCGAEFTSSRYRITCGDECSTERRRQRRREYRRREPVTPIDPVPLNGGRWVPRRGIQVWEAA